MSGKDRFLCLLTCAVFGLAGGALSNLMFLRHGHAQVQHAKVIRAERFEVVDGKNEMRALLGMEEPGGPRLIIYRKYPQMGTSLGFNNLAVYDHKGERRIGVGAWQDSPPSLNIYDTAGNIVWTASAK